jgi:hypothetical protein
MDSSSLPCFDIRIGKKKCPPANDPKKFYCNVTTGKCCSMVTNTKKPWGYDSMALQNPDWGYDPANGLFGPEDLINKHREAMKNAIVKDETLNQLQLDKMSVSELKNLAKVKQIAISLYDKKIDIRNKILAHQQVKRKEQKDEMEQSTSTVSGSSSESDGEDYDYIVDQFQSTMSTTNPVPLPSLQEFKDQLIKDIYKVSKISK